MKRISKICIVFLLIFAFNFYSFAAISVADGSSFVTKAEFSSDLNNLTNRISQMENSLDAKIDSLVSSYLSRNGIWNGAAQTIKKNTAQNTEDYFYAVMGIGASSSKMTYNTLFYNSAAAQYAAAANSSAASSLGYSYTSFYKLTSYGYGQTYTLIEKLSKSGLLCVNYTYKCQSGAPHNGTRYRKPSDNAGRLGFWSWQFSFGAAAPLTWTFYEYTQAGVQVGEALYVLSQPFDSMSIQVADQGAKCTYVNSQGSFYCFVSKENKIMIKTSTDGMTTNSSVQDRFGISASYDRTNFNEAIGIFNSVQIKKATIY